MKRYISNEHLEKLIWLHQSATEMTEKTDGVLDALIELKEIVQELRDGLRCIIRQQDPTDEYYQELEKTTLTIRRHYDRTKDAES